MGGGSVIEGDRPCPRCGYNLRGLRTGQRCPECGGAVRDKKTSGRFRDNLLDAPIGYIQMIAGALLIMAGSVAGGVAVFVAAMWSAFQGAPLSTPSLALLAIALCATWAGATFFVCSERKRGEHTVRDELLDNARLRLIARLTQLLPMAVVGLVWAAVASKVSVLFVGAGAAALACVFGLVPLSVYLSALADWAGDVNVSNRFGASAWSIVVCGSLAIVLWVTTAVGLGPRLLVAWAAGGLTLLTLGGVFTFVTAVLSLAWTGAWAVRNSYQSEEREQRLADMRARRAEEQLAKVMAADAAMTAMPRAAVGAVGGAVGGAAAGAVGLSYAADDDQAVPLAAGGGVPLIVHRQRLVAADGRGGAGSGRDEGAVPLAAGRGAGDGAADGEDAGGVDIDAVLDRIRRMEAEALTRDEEPIPLVEKPVDGGGN